MNQQNYSSAIGAGIGAQVGVPYVPPEGSLNRGTDEEFQQVLLSIATKAADGAAPSTLIELFCRITREFFQVSGVYFWRSHGSDEVIGEKASGKMAEAFAGKCLRADQSTVTVDAVRQRRTIFANHVESVSLPAAREYDAHSLMAAPLVVSNEVIGAITFLHDSNSEFFNEDSAAKATILAGQLGSLLEAARLSQVSREEHRRAEILADVAQALHGTPDLGAVIEALADRLRLLLRTRLVCILLRREGPFELKAVSAETPQLATAARARHDRQTLRFAADLAQRAVSAGEPLTLSIGADVHSLGNLVSPGMLIAAPFRTARTQGAILIYPRHDGIFTAEERALVAAIAGFGAVAVAHAELHATAHAQAQELHQLLEISSELNSSNDLDHFLQTFVLRASGFLGFGRCFIALLEDDHFQVRYGVERGEPSRVDNLFPEGVATKALRAKEVFWTDEASRTPGANLEAINQYKVHQFLAAPLLGSSGKLLGMFGLLDRLDGTGISQEDIRRARALSNQAAVMLEVARNLHSSEQHRKRAEALIELAREIDGALRLPEFARRFVCRTAELTGARAGLLAIQQEGTWQVVALHQRRLALKRSEIERAQPETAENAALAVTPAGTESEPERARIAGPLLDHDLERSLATALTEFIEENAGNVLSAPAEKMLGKEVASALQWSGCTLMRLAGSNGEVAGILCLSESSTPMSHEDRDFLETMAGHAAMALENARLFTKIEQSNRHWTEIFDAISDFIVVHDQSDKVLRVNRSLASMIGVAPAELIGINMRALMALASDSNPYSCPFCRSMSDELGEFAHPVFDRIYLVSTSRVHSASGEGLQTIHVFKDISDRSEAERRYRELFDNIQEGLFFSTPGGRFVEVNDAMVRMLGYSSREELLQIDIPTQLYLSPEQRERHARLMEEQGHLRNFEATLRRKDGSPIHVLINAFGLYDSTGRLLQIRGLMLDVTGLRTYQSELHRERDFSGKILNNTQSLILVADTAGLISYANRRWYDAGFEQGELLGRPLLELAAPGFTEPLSDAVRSTLGGQQVDNLELEIVRRNGAIGKLSANLSPMRDESGAVTSIVAVLTDITDSAVLRDKLVHAEKMAAVGQLVSGVAHEVNNPLTAILGFADLLMENPELPEGARKDLRVILQEAQRTKQIVQNLLSFARQMPPQRNPVQLNAILRRTIQLRSYDFNSHGVEVVEHLDEGLPEVVGDAHQLQQVFLNILNNAYDAVREVGRPARIEIMSTKSGDGVEVSFSDNGNGISHPDRIFDPFFTTKEVGKGTGLGLSICYGIVKEHGGEILCHNNIGGKGATFIVRLPGALHAASMGVAAGVKQP
ncbi:MAG TPA: PAS domain S-box protein [Candidatus Sulfotelmatobacter sp.]|nr:PAS domain S-box protein [Candidatus Sulfotelmatobacter sp.]